MPVDKEVLYYQYTGQPGSYINTLGTHWDVMDTPDVGTVTTIWMGHLRYFGWRCYYSLASSNYYV